MAEPLSVPGYSVKQLNNEDQADIQSLLERCADYRLLSSGKLPEPTDAEELIRSGPVGKSLGDKFIFGIYPFTETTNRNTTLVALIDCFRDYPITGRWWLGLMIVDPLYRGKGLGGAFYRSFENWSASQGMQTIYIGVLSHNDKALRFWTNIGFSEVERKPNRMGIRENIEIIMIHKVR